MTKKNPEIKTQDAADISIHKAMIAKSTIDKIIEAVDIVEVVGEFVDLKKRGANYVGLSPFTHEKTPSFSVSPSKNIFKDFSSGLGGTAVTFLMEHEKISYPEALRWLAKKYSIPIQESNDTFESKEESLHRESLLILTAYAANFFQATLSASVDGPSIGLKYLLGRGLQATTIQKFSLGYAPESWNTFTDKALAEGYQAALLQESGLALQREDGSLYDRYRGSVLFPIHNLTGRIIGFGARTLKNDKNIPKYVNSPESAIYHKSDVLYGLYFAKKAIREQDRCYLVEGYADVLSVHQAGVENVVASLGTALTKAQIRLIARFTQNITILYDGDPAGIKASLRSLDMILEEGLNVQVVLFPDGHDPDSFVQERGGPYFKDYIAQQQQDFILYKTQILLKEAGNDVIQKANTAQSVIESIAKIPDPIKVALFIRECSALLQIEERALVDAVNHIKMQRLKKSRQSKPDYANYQEFDEEQDPTALKETGEPDACQEKELVRLLLLYGHRMVDWQEQADTYIGSFIIDEVSDVAFTHPTSKAFMELYCSEIEKGILPDTQFFTNYPDRAVADLAVSLLLSPYTLSSNWYNKYQIAVPDEQTNIKDTILRAIFSLKKKKVGKILESIHEELGQAQDPSDQEILLSQYMQLKDIEKDISAFLGSVVLK